MISSGNLLKTEDIKVNLLLACPHVVGVMGHSVEIENKSLEKRPNTLPVYVLGKLIGENLISAPYRLLVSPDGEDYFVGHGTSFSAPYAAMAAALGLGEARRKNPAATWDAKQTTQFFKGGAQYWIDAQTGEEVRYTGQATAIPVVDAFNGVLKIRDNLLSQSVPVSSSNKPSSKLRVKRLQNNFFR
jgi:hypothetical protein